MTKLTDLYSVSKKYNVSIWAALGLVIYIGVFIYIFLQNFIFSQSVDSLTFREVDDVAFQHYLRDAHKNFKLFKLNGYAYGWIYWFPMTIITYPFYFLSAKFGIDMPLLVIPRQMSLIFTMATAYFLYKILSVYTKDAFLKTLGLLLFLSFDTLGVSTLRFGTIAQTTFFSCLSFYFAIRHEILTKKDLLFITLAFASAAATKLSALIMAPLIVMVVLDRHRWKLSIGNLKIFISYSVLFIIMFFLLSHVSINGVIDQLKQQGSGRSNPFWDTISMSYPLNIYITLVLLAGLFLRYLYKTRTQDYNRRDTIYILATLILTNLYLVLSVRMYIFYIKNYFSSVGFLLVLGVLCLERFKYPYKYIIGILLLVANLVLNWGNIVSDSIGGVAVYSNRVKNNESAVGFQNELQGLIGSPHDYQNKLCMLSDYQVPMVYSNLRDNVIVVSIFENIHRSINNLPQYDYVLLYKRGNAFLEQMEWDKIMSTLPQNVRDEHAAHRRTVRTLLDTKHLKDIEYALLYEDKDYLVFKLVIHR